MVERKGNIPNRPFRELTDRPASTTRPTTEGLQAGRDGKN
jgi:hypothetical protein